MCIADKYNHVSIKYQRCVHQKRNVVGPALFPPPQPPQHEAKSMKCALKGESAKNTRSNIVFVVVSVCVCVRAKPTLFSPGFPVYNFFFQHDFST